ncbi:hypothetical protein RD792_016124 [Penstemon davidsonii]|uniref:squalene monooxygenase n=1 Tax=Penstemon davidsonii TaxID=160366 RepID=A0ABR0CJH8_9LAMI|nr:hypothetical protein RD792_016124 [Penstemon davidsonii]
MSRGKTFFSHSNGELNCSNITTSFDVVIVGAAVGGSALAHALAKDGRKVHVIERNLNEPNTISGELLQPAGYLKLLELGLDDCVRDIDAQKVVGYAIHNNGKSTTLSFPLENYDADVAARTFHHGRFVQKLREKAASLPNNEVRFFADIPGPKVPSVSNGQMSHYLKTVVAPQVPSEMYNAFISSVNKGDALNMRHVITGGGMTAALNDVSFLCNILKHLNLDDTFAVTKKTEYFYKYRKPKAFTINIIADALYKIVCASPEENRMEFQLALFNYLCLGQPFSAGVVGLISGLNPQPRKLVLYLFVIIVYMVGFILFPFPTPKRVYAASRLVVAAIVFPIIMKNVMKQVEEAKPWCSNFLLVNFSASFEQKPLVARFEMDLETENRIATILLKEANELCRQAQSEGALAYLHRPTARSKPHSRFLTATVLGVQQANRAVEVNEMWRLREKQLELNNRLERTRNGRSSRRSHEDGRESRSSRDCSEVEPSASASLTSKKRTFHDLPSVDDEGLKDDEIEEFLHSRTKRGRGAVGSRMDETGPYLPPCLGSANTDEELTKARSFLGPERPFPLKYRLMMNPLSCLYTNEEIYVCIHLHPFGAPSLRANKAISNGDGRAGGVAGLQQRSRLQWHRGEGRGGYRAGTGWAQGSAEPCAQPVPA